MGGAGGGWGEVGRVGRGVCGYSILFKDETLEESAIVRIARQMRLQLLAHLREFALNA